MSHGAKIKAKIDNIQISPETAERIRAALKFHGLSLDEFIEAALRLHLMHLDRLQFEMERDDLQTQIGKLKQRGEIITKEKPEMNEHFASDGELDELDRLFTSEPGDPHAPVRAE